LSVTTNLLLQLCPKASPTIVKQLPDALNKWLPHFQINTPLRIAHFLAQAAHESDHFKTTVEYASGKAYEGRKDLGNTVPGYGVRYKGRGIFQLTGYANYAAYGAKLRKLGLNIDLVANPERAAEVEISVLVACLFWEAKGLNSWADRDDVEMITKRINGGKNGLAERTRLLAKAKTIVQPSAPEAPIPSVPEATVPPPAPIVVTIPPPLPPPPIEETPTAPIAPEPPRSMGTSKIGNTSVVIGATEVGDIVTQINETTVKMKELKENAESFGIFDILSHLTTQPRFWMALAVVVSMAAVWYWRRQHRQEGV
jgi:predicted chitinase